eukprot:3587224-Pyramimonas_sp.AAC.1
MQNCSRPRRTATRCRRETCSTTTRSTSSMTPTPSGGPSSATTTSARPGRSMPPRPRSAWASASQRARRSRPALRTRWTPHGAGVDGAAWILGRGGGGAVGRALWHRAPRQSPTRSTCQAPMAQSSGAGGRLAVRPRFCAGHRRQVGQPTRQGAGAAHRARAPPPYRAPSQGAGHRL